MSVLRLASDLGISTWAISHLYSIIKWLIVELNKCSSNLRLRLANFQIFSAHKTAVGCKLVPLWSLTPNMMAWLYMKLGDGGRGFSYVSLTHSLSVFFCVYGFLILQTWLSVRGSSLASMLTLAKISLVDITVPAFADGWARTVTSVSICLRKTWDSFHLSC